MRRRPLAAAAGVVADFALGEPPLHPHPVAAFGALVAAVERPLHRDTRVAGTAHAASGLLAGLAAGAAFGSTTVATYLAVAGRALGRAALDVEDALSRGDLSGARRLLPGLVGRDPQGLDEGEIARAVVESVAESSVDALGAPAVLSPRRAARRAPRRPSAPVAQLRGRRGGLRGSARAAPRCDEPLRGPGGVTPAARLGTPARRDRHSEVGEALARCRPCLGGDAHVRGDRHVKAALPARTPTAAVPSGAHGGDGARVAAALGVDPREVLDLSASTNPFAPDVVGLAAPYLDGFRRYPDPSGATTALGEATGVDADRLLFTNGGSKAISLVAAELAGHVEEPGFPLHPRGGGPRWRSNPHNPTGRLALSHERAGVWDEAFYPLATGCWTRGDPDAVVVGFLTKLCSCSGLRLGYVLAAPELVARLATRRVCWSVNSLAAALVPELLATDDLPGWAAGIAELRAKLVGVLDAHGLEPLASDANYVLCARAGGLRERLAPYGVVVRDCASFGLSGHARVAVPGELGLARLADALEASAP